MYGMVTLSACKILSLVAFVFLDLAWFSPVKLFQFEALRCCRLPSAFWTHITARACSVTVVTTDGNKRGKVCVVHSDDHPEERDCLDDNAQTTYKHTNMVHESFS